MKPGDHELARLEWEQREQRRIDRLRIQSGLPRDKTFQTLQVACFPPLIRAQLEREFHCVTAVAGFTDDFQIGLLIQDELEAFAHERVIVGQQDTNLTKHCVWRGVYRRKVESLL